MKSKEELIQNPQSPLSHIVLLGAGASCAAFPNGDFHGNKLPLMSNLLDTLELRPLLEGISYDREKLSNFELLYAFLNKNSEYHSVLEKINIKIFTYFSSLQLPDQATHYDRLLLSLRQKDVIYTFNWDPFLMDAYARNRHINNLPQIFFLHGNVRIGFCEADNEFGYLQQCPKCNRLFERVPLLFPIENKDYHDAHKYIKQCWKTAKNNLANAFTLTIFGYSAPDSDIEAKSLLTDAWLTRSEREMLCAGQFFKSQSLMNERECSLTI